MPAVEKRPSRPEKFDGRPPVEILSDRFSSPRRSVRQSRTQQENLVNPTISIINKSRIVSDADVKRVLPALQKQITKHFEPVWGWGANLKFNAKKFDMQVIIKDT